MSTLVKKSFPMSCFVNTEHRAKAMAEYYEGEAERLEMELVTSLETTAHLERVTLTLSRKLEAAEKALNNIEGFALDMKAGAEKNVDMAKIGMAIINGKNAKPKTTQYYINTGMGKIQDRSTLPFLTDNELDELDSIGYSGKSLDGNIKDRETYLNTLDKGTFVVSCTKRDNGDFAETFLIIRTI
jgi:hypothetical protein